MLTVLKHEFNFSHILVSCLHLYMYTSTVTLAQSEQIFYHVYLLTGHLAGIRMPWSSLPDCICPSASCSGHQRVLGCWLVRYIAPWLMAKA